MKLDARTLTLQDIILIVLKGGAALNLKGDIFVISKLLWFFFGKELKMLARLNSIKKDNN